MWDVVGRLPSLAQQQGAGGTQGRGTPGILDESLANGLAGALQVALEQPHGTASTWRVSVVWGGRGVWCVVWCGVGLCGALQVALEYALTSPLVIFGQFLMHFSARHHAARAVCWHALLGVHACWMLIFHSQSDAMAPVASSGIVLHQPVGLLIEIVTRRLREQDYATLSQILGGLFSICAMALTAFFDNAPRPEMTRAIAVAQQLNHAAWLPEYTDNIAVIYARRMQVIQKTRERGVSTEVEAAVARAVYDQYAMVLEARTATAQFHFRQADEVEIEDTLVAFVQRLRHHGRVARIFQSLYSVKDRAGAENSSGRSDSRKREMVV